MADPRTRAALEQIAGALGLTVAVFEAGRPDADPLTVLGADEHGRRIAEAFRTIDDAANRRALADTVVAIAATMTIKAAGRR